jgi:toluene monooxygenase system protein E
MRAGRLAPFEQNPSSAPNLWFLTYRENSPLRAQDWNGFRDPDALTYKAYVNLQAESESRIGGVLEAHADAGADAALTGAQVTLLGRLFTPARYLYHGFQQAEAYIGYIAPSSYVTTAAGYATADFLRRVTTTAYRTRELQIAWPDAGIGTAEREIWETDPAWQPARKAVEYALVAYDWGEAFTALNLVLAPTLENVLLTQFGAAEKDSGDELSWLLTTFLSADADRRGRWSRALADYAVQQRPENRDALAKWVRRWAPRADEAAAGLGEIIAASHGGSAADVAARARAAREEFLAGLLSPDEGPAGDTAGDTAGAQAG